MRKLIRNAEKQGLTVERSSGGHWKVSNKEGAFIFLSFSPSTTVFHQSLKRLKSIGYQP
jgi:predicted RNA binding protein YcfA (HicA-like mRNA interferase family)